ncbi:hypothetical protein LSCM1_03441 [Leishmania martiniquensis]|uniref:Uncharacterized protein n=1 Tax=Leishmania martiniquensis TaxID=1580590 RepID=A0A836KRB0_9TRYP|nr:hypothetical protein LSCM1_03441 [Leishmania martiniquensis]
MGRSHLSPQGTTTEVAMGSSPLVTQPARSSLDIWPEAAPEDTGKGWAHHRESVATPRDQLLYLQALYPYALHDQLLAVIGNADGADEAANRAYEALNPDYAGFPYLKEQHDLSTNAKLPSTQRATAFVGLKESLQERAANAFRAGGFGNLSQLQEYEETVGLFIVDTSDWDRATLLPPADLGEMMFKDLPLREEPTTYETVVTTIDCDSDNGSERKRDGRWWAPSSSLAMPSGSNGFADRRSRSILRAADNAASTPQAAGKPCKGSWAQLRDAADERLTGPRDGDGDGNPTAGVVYLQSNDPPCAAPIIAWAPEAIRVEPAEARREREGALRVFDEAAFFRDPLLQVETPPSHWARAHVNMSPLDLAITSSSTAVGEVHVPAVSVPAGAQSSDTAALAAPQCIDTLFNEKSEDHEPFESCGTPIPQLGDRNGLGSGSTEERFSAEGLPAPSSYRRTSSCLPAAFVGAQVGASVSTGGGTTDRTQRILGEDDAVSSTGALKARSSMRDAACKALRARKPHPLTTSVMVRQRMLSLSPVGNVIFRETSLHARELLPQHIKVSSKRPGEETSTFSISASQHQQAGAALDSWQDIPADEGDTAGRDVGERRGECPFNAGTVHIPAAHDGCSSLDPAAFLDAEEERWETVVTMLAPYERVFGCKLRCELVQCIYNECPKLRANVTLILTRLLRVVRKALCGKELAEGMTEEPLEVPFFGPILLSTSPIKLTDLSFREEKCSIEFCEGGSRLKVKLDLKLLSVAPIQFAYISEAAAARQARLARQWQRGMPVSSSREAAWALRRKQPEQYTEGVTRGTATIKAANVRVKGLVYVWLMASGRTHIAFQKTTVSVGSFRASTSVTKLNILCTLGAPILRLMVQRGIQDVLQRVHTI